jgi:DNA polymerase-1
MLSAPSNKKLFLIDAYALIYRAYYAFIKSPRINSKGLNTSAVFGFTNAVLEIIRVEKPTHISVVFDPPGGSFRNVIYPEYKANRDETPEDIKLSVPLIKKVLEGLQISTRMEMGYEADDLIGYLAKKAEKEGYDVYMMTPDKDFGQLVSDRVKMYRPGRGGNPAEIWGPEEICARFGLNRTEQVIDYLGLMGDASDNIPGVPGVGAKTAAKLLCEFDSIDGLYENTDQLKGKLKEKVEANHEQALLSRKLATIVLDIPAEVNIEGMVKNEVNVSLLEEILEELEFRTLLRKLIPNANVSTETPTATPVKIITNTVGQVSMFGDNSEVLTTPTALPPPLVDQVRPQTTKPSGDYHVADSPAGRSTLIAKLQESSGWGFHIITDGFNPMLDKLLGFSFAIKPEEAWYVPLGDGASSIIEAFKPLLEDQSKEITATNYKFSRKVFGRLGVQLSKNVFDCMIAHYLLDPDQTHKLENLAEIFLDYNAMSLEALVGKGKSRKSFDEIDREVVSVYACESADLVLRLAKIFKVEIENAGMTKLLNDVELPLISILADMELTGVRIDEEMLGKYSIDLGLQIDTLQVQILKKRVSTLTLIPQNNLEKFSLIRWQLLTRLRKQRQDNTKQEKMS